MREVTVGELQQKSLHEYLYDEFGIWGRYGGDSLSGNQWWNAVYKIFGNDEESILAIRKLINARWGGVLLHSKVIALPRTKRERNPHARGCFVWFIFCEELLNAVLAAGGSRIKVAALLYFVGSTRIYLSESPIPSN